MAGEIGWTGAVSTGTPLHGGERRDQQNLQATLFCFRQDREVMVVLDSENTERALPDTSEF